MRSDPLENYLASRAVTAPWRLEGEERGGFAGCVVIPALAESRRLFTTLESLAANPPELLQRFLVVVVVNHRVDAQQADKLDNLQALARLRRLGSPLRLALVDAATPGFELAEKTGGVGLARKIGLDLALPRLARDGIMVSLDADTMVEPGYLQAIVSHFADNGAGGAVIPFCHQRGATEGEERAITLYELFLRHYVQGLRQAGSPYAFHCIGSAMACSSAAYLKMGGMNSRRAAEDFYFLQQLQRTSGIAELRGTTVHPAARSSHRVPFGTGNSISRILAQGEQSQTFYRTDCFTILGDWLELVAGSTTQSAVQIMNAASSIDHQLAEFLSLAGFQRVWERLQDNAGGEAQLRSAFHGWFDGLKTVRLVHHLSVSYPRCPANEAIPGLLRLAGLTSPEPEPEQLRLLRLLQNGVT